MRPGAFIRNFKLLAAAILADLGCRLSEAGNGLAGVGARMVQAAERMRQEANGK